jgi:cytochrome c oxidase assembly protein subunit 11
MCWSLVAFVIDPRLSKDVTTITLSYTFFEVGGKTPAAPESTAAVGGAVSAPSVLVTGVGS